MGRSAIDYREYRFPCGPEDCSESVTCWNDTSERPLLNCPTSELASTFVDQLQCGVYGREGVTVLQRRTILQPSVDFNRTLFDYETGFGSDGNFWIGLNRIHRLTSRGSNLLTIDIMLAIIGVPQVMPANENYTGFWVDDASNRYTMYVGPSNVGRTNSLNAANGQPFTAPDGGRTGCANDHESGWWFGSPCLSSKVNINGRHNSTGPDGISLRDKMTMISCKMTLLRRHIHCDRTCPNGGTCRKSRTATSEEYVCDCQPRYTGRRCEDLVEDTTVAATHATTVKAIPTTTVKAIPTTTTNGSNFTSPATPSSFDVDDLFAYVVLPVFVAIVFAITAYSVRKCGEIEKKEINLNAGEETPLVRKTPLARKTKRHKKRDRTKHKGKKGTTSKSTQERS